MSQATKNKAPSPSPRIKNGTPDTSFAASPFAKSLGTPSSPFKASLTAFPALPDLDEYAGFDDSWTPDFASRADANQAGPSSRPRNVSTASRHRRPSQGGRHLSQRSLGGGEDLESFFEDGSFNNLPDQPASSTSIQSQSTHNQGKQAGTALYPPYPSQTHNELQFFPTRPRASSVSVLTGRPKDSLAHTPEYDLAKDLGTPATTTYDAPSTVTGSTPAMCYSRNQAFLSSPVTTADTGLASPSFSSSMIHPRGPATPGYRVLLSPPVDYSSMIRQYNESIANTRAATNQTRADFEREKAEIRANPPIAPYEVRKVMHQLAEQKRKVEKERQQAEIKKEFQRAKAAADAAIAEKQRIGNEEYAKLKAQHIAAADAARKVEAERRGKPEADKKADEAKKKAAAEAHEAQIQAVMAANEAASPTMTDAERQYFVAYQTHLQNGGLPIPQGEYILKKYYSTGSGNAAIMQHLQDADQYQRLAAQQAEARKQAQQKAEEAAHAEAVRRAQEAQIEAQLQAQAAVMAGSPGQRLFQTPPRSPRSDPGPDVSSVPHASPSLSGSSNSPSPIANIVEQVLQHLCEQEESDRVNAVEAMLYLGQRIEKARTIRVTKDYTPENKQIENSHMQLCASIYPFPRPGLPQIRGILQHQLKNMIMHFRKAAAQYGAHEVTQICYIPTQEDVTGVNTAAARMGKVSAVLIQHVQDTPEGPVATPPLETNRPCREYARYAIPEGVMRTPVPYEILVENQVQPRTPNL